MWVKRVLGVNCRIVLKFYIIFKSCIGIVCELKCRFFSYLEYCKMRKKFLDIFYKWRFLSIIDLNYWSFLIV